MTTELARAQSVLISPDLKTTSLIVAEAFGKRHSNVLRDIRNLEIPDKYHRLNFEPFKNNDLTGESVSHVEMTRDGFTLLVMGFSGRKAMEWKVKFLEAFNAMEAELNKRPVVITDAQARAIQDAIKLRILMTGEKPGDLYEMLKSSFQVPKYRRIRREDFAKALEIIETRPVMTACAGRPAVTAGFTETDVKHLVKGAIGAGLEIDQINVDHEGRIALVTKTTHTGPKEHPVTCERHHRAAAR